MALQIGIVGLPNVGKSTLFNALLKMAQAESANFPFTTIEPNVGVVGVPDPRLDALADLIQPDEITPATVRFVDIAGLVRGAHQGEGLGNQFLSHIREVDAIAMVVRFFDDPNVIHVAGQIDPLEDIRTIRLELILADLGTITKRIESLHGRLKTGDRVAEAQIGFYVRVQNHLEAERLATELTELTDEEQAWLRELSLLTAKPLLYVANVSEQQLGDPTSVDRQLRGMEISEDQITVISAKVEADLADLSSEEQAEYLHELGLTEPGRNQLIRRAYETLGLITYFTAGPKEVRAWTIRRGTKAPQAAAEIHTDFERGFIRAEVITYNDYMRLGGELKAREAGRMRSEGKDYVVADGDIILFRFNI